MTEGAKDFYLFFIQKRAVVVDAFSGISRITIDGLTINPAPGTPVQSVQLCNREIMTENEVSCVMNNVIVNKPEKVAVTKGLFSNEAVLLTNLPVKGGFILLSKAKNIKLKSE